MKKRGLIELLADHAEALNQAEDKDNLDTAGWLTAYSPAEKSLSLLTLLQLAQAVKRALTPIDPSPFFLSELKSQLAQNNGGMVEKRPFSREMWLALIAGLVGLLLLVFRFLMGRSRTTATAV